MTKVDQEYTGEETSTKALICEILEGAGRIKEEAAGQPIITVLSILIAENCQVLLERLGTS
jgi:hypothetical protein